MIWLQAPETVLVRRAAGRRIDPTTGAIYNLEHVPPPAETVSRLVSRDHDDEQSFLQRLQVFESQHHHVLPFFARQVCKIDATLEPDQVFQSIMRAMEGRFQLGIGASTPQDLSTTYPVPQETPDNQTGVTAMDVDEWSEDGDVDPRDEQRDGVTLVVAPCRDIGQQGGEANVMISVQIPDSTTRMPRDIVCVIDVSGSMGIAATYETTDGDKRDDGLSVLDIVKHAVKTVISSLKEGDRLALVSFNHEANTVLNLTDMTPSGQAMALEALDSLEDEGQTNIWAGILAAMEALREGGEDQEMISGRQSAVLLLTDGQPNVVPPRGHVTEMRNYKDSHNGFAFQLNTFGFGYDLDSELLLDLAVEGNGTYAFIPDAVIVGTTFVNSIANVLSTLSQSATISLMPRSGAELVGPVLGEFAELNESWGRVVKLGPLQYGQSRDVLVPMRIPDGSSRGEGSVYLDAVLTYPRADGTTGRISIEASCRKTSPHALLAGCRADVVSTGYGAIGKAVKNKGKQAGADVSDLNKRLAALVAESNPNDGLTDSPLLALKADVDGRMSKALQGKDRFNRWGKHYLRALMRSHQVQLCTNFMDPGLQPYGGALFRSLREAGDQIFLSLPPPEKKIPSWAAAYMTQQQQTQQAHQNRQTASPAPTLTAPAPQMNTYYAGAGGGCFAPSSVVQLVEQSESGTVGVKDVPISCVRAGDALRVANGGAARVQCVIEIARGKDRNMIDLPQGLRITPRHPVRIGGVWQHPLHVPNASVSPCTEGRVFNLVLDRCHILLVDNVECVTWGHGLKDGILDHYFFGTDRVVEELAAFHGWEDGFVRIEGMMRDEGSGSVVGLWGPAKKRYIRDEMVPEYVDHRGCLEMSRL
eukprot:TRINITY_DN11904_c0_g1_i1.p1 TRINITY_DN11904_c0_g1~~TRINITY_DN11904_c0_g1_i1.p1  ORF type:complete len:1021 (-),score=117.12 TRINITY_DN11904_c0_g1_i1:307-2919(-)